MLLGHIVMEMYIISFPPCSGELIDKLWTFEWCFWNRMKMLYIDNVKVKVQPLGEGKRVRN